MKMSQISERILKFITSAMGNRKFEQEAKKQTLVDVKNIEALSA